MTEKVFHAELAACYRAHGWWAAKWPDAPVSRSMAAGADGKLRFTVPKPFDLVLCAPDGHFGAIECKLVRARTFRVDPRTTRQVETLRELAGREAYAALALNFRFTQKRPPARVNRAFLLTGRGLDAAQWAPGMRLRLDELQELALELERIPGGWTFPATARPGPLDSPRADRPSSDGGGASVDVTCATALERRTGQLGFVWLAPAPAVTPLPTER